MVAGAHKGEGLGNKFLANIREVDAILEVVRFFEDKDIIHVSGGVDPKRDVDVISIELALADLETVGKRLEAASKEAKQGNNREALVKKAALEKYQRVLSEGIRANEAVLTEEETKAVKVATFDHKTIFVCYER